ncbi:MAG: RING finger protein [Sulfobacillus sp.]
MRWITFLPPGGFNEFIVKRELLLNREYTTMCEVEKEIKLFERNYYRPIVETHKKSCERLSDLVIAINKITPELEKKEDDLKQKREKKNLLVAELASLTELEESVEEKREEVCFKAKNEIRNVSGMLSRHFESLAQNVIKTLSQFEQPRLPDCAACKIKPIDSAYSCGHCFCGDCARKADRCYLCRADVKSFKLYL